MIVAGFLLNERTGIKGWSGALIALAGVIWLTLESSPQENAPNPMLGNFLEILAMICAAGYMIAIRILTARYSPLFLTAVQAFAGCFFFFPFLLLPKTELPTEMVFSSAAAVFYLGTVVTIGAFGLYNYGLKHVPVSRASSYVNLIPVFSVMLGWIILGETLSGNQLLAAAVVMLGVWLTQQRGAKKQIRV
jgi:drug/metabolite transporter (DMT)-like permease